MTSVRQHHLPLSTLDTRTLDHSLSNRESANVLSWERPQLTMVRQVPPLRISKTPSSSPAKSAAGRPLSEISSTSQRRNSPSWNQATKASLVKMMVSRDSASYNNDIKTTRSPQPDHWTPKSPNMSHSRFDENHGDHSDSPSLSSSLRKASIEKLQQASRVKNSNIFALESSVAYDPERTPIIERPTANRPLSTQMANNSFTKFDYSRKENSSPVRSPVRNGHKRTDSQIDIPMSSYMSPSKSPRKNQAMSGSPSPSPPKSSLARVSQFSGSRQNSVFDPENGTWSEEDRAQTPRAQKSVTFHKEPPVVQEYEQPTPEPSVTTASDRDESWDSTEEYYDDSILDDVNQQQDDSFDADLENADKTPVVLPEDWAHMSPVGARKNLVNNDDDVFARPQLTGSRRSGSALSDGSETRPLPPLPSFMTGHTRTGSGSSITAASERAALMQFKPLSPPKRAPLSKDDILQMTKANGASVFLQDRLQLMTRPEKKDDLKSKASEDTLQGYDVSELVITDLDTGEKTPLQITFDEAALADHSVLDDLPEPESPPRISRESILRNLRHERYAFENDDTSDASELNENDRSYSELAKMHPDQPIPSRESDIDYSDGRPTTAHSQTDSVLVKSEPTDEDELDLSSIPAFAAPGSPSCLGSPDFETSVLHHNIRSQSAEEDEVESRYSESLEPEIESTFLEDHRQPEEVDDGKESLHDAMQLLTVQDYSQEDTPKQTSQTSKPITNGLPTYLSTDDYDFGVSDYMKAPSPVPTEKHLSSTNSWQDIGAVARALQPSVEFSQPDYPLSAEEVDISPPDSPASVVHNAEREVSPLEPELPEIPETAATIKTGGKLKTRPSATPADFEMMAEQRRMVSIEHPVPAIPQKYFGAEVDYEGRDYYSPELDETNECTQEAEVPMEYSPPKDSSRGHGHKKTLTIDLDIPQSNPNDTDGLGLVAAFDRVIEGQKVGSAFPPPSFARFSPTHQQKNPPSTQYGFACAASSSPTAYSLQTQRAGTNLFFRTQKGYLTRQNTKIVVASNRFDGEIAQSKDLRPTSTTGEGIDRSSETATNGTRKASGEQYLKTEPWVGKRKSMRRSSVYRQEPAPPLPGHESALGVVNENRTSSYAEEIGDGFERGRLFVKVVRVKNLDLPLPHNERVDFQLTLDNGLHCVTTASLELGQSAPIGQEFELVVLDDLEFQLTLSTKLTPPTRPSFIPSSSPVKKQHKATGLSRFLTSPKKRAEKERLEREAVEAEERRVLDEAKKHRSINPTAYDLMHDMVNHIDGSFARSYVNLKTHEKDCYGRKLTVDVPCYNEWALEKDMNVVTSVRSKRGTNTGPIRRPPYVIGQMEVQLLYVPKPKGATDEEMPRSMGSAVREMNKAGDVKVEVHEGHLSQQGGDCKHWRRRFFRLQGSKLTAYHEHTHQKRAVINLSKASRLVDDKTTLVADPSSQPGGKSRRKSAFAEEDEGYAYVEEGFRIRFSNGETIDFYAENTPEKDRWMQALSKCIGKKDPGKKKTTWTDLVLARESAGEEATYAARRATQAQEVSKPSTAPALPRGGTQVYDFTKPPPMIPEKAPGRKTGPGGSLAPRPTTPTMGEHRGHRTREANESVM
ncbi:Bud site selection protein BUD4 [Acrodontium crateriforme]|uniref:Bud site selection protein BUD4 n=1 Tax=Acrodontium crateriforme TaxID=150365 RepID=A0AAQ3M873_9PEZI|nr:Bud site selection protein BUD4 [Acrodontium crateriforme]